MDVVNYFFIKLIYKTVLQAITSYLAIYGNPFYPTFLSCNEMLQLLSNIFYLFILSW